jgi:hypothetical protein
MVFLDLEHISFCITVGHVLMILGNALGTFIGVWLVLFGPGTVSRLWTIAHRRGVDNVRRD